MYTYKAIFLQQNRMDMIKVIILYKENTMRIQE